MPRRDRRGQTHHARKEIASLRVRQLVCWTTATIAAALAVPGGATAAQLPFPVNQTPPVITGTGQDGNKLTVQSNGTWTHEGTLTFTYEWQVCYLTGPYTGKCNEPFGYSGPTLTLSHGEVGQLIAANVTATDHLNGLTSPGGDGDRSEASSNRIGPIVAPPPPANAGPPTVSGSPGVGQTLTAAPGHWSSPDLLHYTYLWLRCNPAGGGCARIVDGARRRVGKDDLGHTLRVEVTAIDQEHQRGKPVLTAPIRISH